MKQPKAYIVLKPGTDKNENVARELMAYVKDKKTRYKHVKVVELVDEIPKSASGKILRRVLRDKMKAGAYGLVVKDAEKTARL